MRRVLVIESDEGLLRAIARNLRVHGFAVSTASSVGEGLWMLEGQDVVVVDLTLPDAHGTVVLRNPPRELADPGRLSLGRGGLEGTRRGRSPETRLHYS